MADNSGWRTLIATFLRCRMSSARYTVAIPPIPSSCSSRYRSRKAVANRGGDASLVSVAGIVEFGDLEAPTPASLTFYPPAQSPPGISAGDEPGAIPEMHNVASLAVGFESSDGVGIDQRGSANADKAVAQPQGQPGQRSPE